MRFTTYLLTSVYLKNSKKEARTHPVYQQIRASFFFQSGSVPPRTVLQSLPQFFSGRLKTGLAKEREHVFLVAFDTGLIERIDA